MKTKIKKKMSKKLNELKMNPKPMVYSCILEGLRKKAAECGYALAVHGTLATDLDLIAVRWADNYESPTYLVERFIEELGNYHFSDDESDSTSLTVPTRRYDNQIHYSIPIYGDWYIDLTVIVNEKVDTTPSSLWTSVDVQLPPCSYEDLFLKGIDFSGQAGIIDVGYMHDSIKGPSLEGFITTELRTVTHWMKAPK